MAVRKSEIGKLHQSFEEQRFLVEGVEAWSARGLMPLFGYETWQYFRAAIDRAITACSAAGKDPERNFIPIEGEIDLDPNRIFRGVTKKSGRGRPPEGMILSRFAAYLVSINGDPSKEPIAFAQVYFAMQTRSMELLEQRLAEVERLEARRQLTKTEKELSSALYNYGVDDAGFGVIRSRGDEALFGLSTAEMKRRLECGSAPLANKLQTVLIRAKDLAAEMTAYNTRESKGRLHGVQAIGNEHVKNNKNVRGALTASGINPATLGPAEDTAKLERRIRKDDSYIAAKAQDLPALNKPTPTTPATTSTKKRGPRSETMRKWFLENHTPAVERSPVADGEYVYPTVDVLDVLETQFPEASDAARQKAAEELDGEDVWLSDAWLHQLHDEAIASIEE